MDAPQAFFDALRELAEEYNVVIREKRSGFVFETRATVEAEEERKALRYAAQREKREAKRHAQYQAELERYQREVWPSVEVELAEQSRQAEVARLRAVTVDDARILAIEEMLARVEGVRP